MRLRIIVITIFYVMVSSMVVNAKGVSNNISYIDPMIGTGGIGHTFPGATTPLGMIQVSPSNDFTSWKRCAGYHYDDKVIKGFAHNHISGAGLSGLGDILLMPTTGRRILSTGSDDNPDNGYRSRFSHSTEIAKAGYYSVKLDDYDVRVELTATKRVGVHRYTFNDGGLGRVVIDPSHNLMEGVALVGLKKIDDRTIGGFKKVDNGVSGKRTVFFVARFSKPFDKFVVAQNGQEILVDSLVSESLIGCVEFENLRPKSNIEVSVAISYVSQSGAFKNLLSELQDFDSAYSAAQRMWQDKVAKINLESKDETFKRIFYTALYHSYISPNLISDVDGRYAINGRVYQSDFPQYSNFSTWDTYRAQHPLFSILEHTETSNIVNSLISRYTQSGVGLPVWECLGHDNICMIGYNTVPVIAEAILKDIKGINTKDAYDAMIDAANSNDKHSPTYDISGIDKYIDRHYVPGEIGCSVSKTVEYNYYDWCISKVAQRLGRDRDAALYLQRSQGYRNLYDKNSGYLFPRLSNGNMIDIDTTRWSPLIQNYVSGNMWGYSTYVPADMGYLVSMHGGIKKFEAFLDRIFQTEIKMQGAQHVDISGFIGRYGHGDEPSHHMIYLYAYAGVPYKSEKLIRDVMRTMYYDTPDGLVNNDDLGQISSWYIFSAMGFYPVSPAEANYVLGTPSADKIILNLESGNKFVVEAKGLSSTNRYIQSVSLNGEKYTKSFISHKDIMKGGKLIFIMGHEPKIDRGSYPNDMPQYVANCDYNKSKPEICYTPYSEDTVSIFNGQKKIILSTNTDGASIRYTIDGSEPNDNSPLFPFDGIMISNDTRLKAKAFRKDLKPSDTFVGLYYRSLMSMNTNMQPLITLKNPTTNYGFEDGRELIDGKLGGVGFAKGGWSGFAGTGSDLVAIIDFGHNVTASEMLIGYLVNSGVWIFPPRRIVVKVGESPYCLTQVAEWSSFKEPTASSVDLVREKIVFSPVNFRYASVEVCNYGPMPSWHGGSGNIPFLFVDELIFR